MAAEFLRRWDEDALVETRRLVAQYETKEDLRDAFQQFIAEKSVNVYILYRELDFYEQVGALERVGAFHLDLVDLLLGRRLVDRCDLGSRRSMPWAPTCTRCSAAWSTSCAPATRPSSRSRANEKLRDQPVDERELVAEVDDAAGEVALDPVGDDPRGIVARLGSEQGTRERELARAGVEPAAHLVGTPVLVAVVEDRRVAVREP